MRIPIRALSLLLVPLLTASSPAATPRVRVIGDSVIDSAVLFLPDGQWGQTLNGRAFQQEAMLSHAGWQYATYFDADRRVCLARRKYGSAQWQVIRFADHRFDGRDTHNASVVGICPADGTIHLSFDHHNDPLRYRVSEKRVASDPENTKFTAERFGPIRDWLETGKPLKKVTYPRFFATPNGRLQMAYRLGGSGNGDTHLADYDPASGTWSAGGVIIGRAGSFEQSNSRCAYENGFSYDARGRLHVTWCWRETGGPHTNHDINFITSADGGATWLNGSRDLIGRRGEVPVTIDTPGIRAVAIPQRRGLINSVSQAGDAAGRVHVITFHLPDNVPEPASWPETRAASRYQHYWRDSDGGWNRHELPFGGGAGTRAQLAVDHDGNTYLVFAFESRLCIATATAESRWTDWQIAHRGDVAVTGEPRFDPVRWHSDRVLSVYVQEMPSAKDADRSPLRAIEFTIE